MRWCTANKDVDSSLVVAPISVTCDEFIWINGEGQCLISDGRLFRNNPVNPIRCSLYAAIDGTA